MREIKFRAWLPKANKMEYDIQQDNDLGDIITDHNYDNGNYILMQYTGLKDWDEKEVFEGDIIQYLYDGCNENDQYIVEWDEENLQFAFKNTKKEEYMALEDMYDCDYGKHSIRVIGNIYDNPELIKE